MKSIHAWGIKQNNLKGVDVDIPIGSFTVVCGPSGSGKSSLAFETLYAEGQRRYIESLSSYSRQFLNKAPKPDLEGIENIPPELRVAQVIGDEWIYPNDPRRLLMKPQGIATGDHQHVNKRSAPVASDPKERRNA